MYHNIENSCFGIVCKYWKMDIILHGFKLSEWTTHKPVCFRWTLFHSNNMFTSLSQCSVSRIDYYKPGSGPSIAQRIISARKMNFEQALLRSQFTGSNNIITLIDKSQNKIIQDYERCEFWIVNILLFNHNLAPVIQYIHILNMFSLTYGASPAAYYYYYYYSVFLIIEKIIICDSKIEKLINNQQK